MRTAKIDCDRLALTHPCIIMRATKTKMCLHSPLRHTSRHTVGDYRWLKGTHILCILVVQKLFWLYTHTHTHTHLVKTLARLRLTNKCKNETTKRHSRSRPFLSCEWIYFAFFASLHSIQPNISQNSGLWFAPSHSVALFCLFSSRFVLLSQTE